MNVLRRIPLRYLIPVLIGAFAALIAAFSYLNTKPVVLDSVEQQTRAELNAELTQTQGVLQILLRNADLNATRSVIASFGANPDHEIMLLMDAEGKVLASTELSALDDQWTDIAPQIERALIARVARTGGAEVRLSGDRQILAGYVSVCPTSGQSLRPAACGFLYYERNIGARKAVAVRALRQEAMYTGLGIGALAFALSLILHFRLTRRIGSLIATTRTFASGDLTARTHIESHDELASLGAELNGMFDTIAQDHETLRLQDRAIASSSNGIIISDALQADQPIIYVNPAFERITGYSAEEVLHKNCRFLQGNGSAQPERDEIRAALRQQRPTRVVLRNYRKDGSLFWNELHIAPVQDDTGKVTHFVGVQNDISQRKASEEALRQSHATLEEQVKARTAEIATSNRKLQSENAERKRAEGQFRAFVESAPDATIIISKSGTIELVNAQTEALFGYGRNELLGKTVEQLIPARLRTEHAGHRRGYFSDPRVRAMGSGMELFGLTKHGREVPIEISLSPIRTADGLWVSAAVRDITARKRADEALRAARDDAKRANTAKTRFLAAASHDLRQPLQSLGMYLDVLEHTASEEQKHEIIGPMSQSLEAMGDLLNALLDVSKLEAGMVKPEFKDFPADELLRSVYADVLPHARDKGLDVRMVPSARAVHSDPVLLQRVVENLVFNAVRYTESGRILFGCRRRGDALRIEVWDTGIGISDDAREQIFEEYVQLDNPARDRNKGLGLGLAIVKRTADLLGHPIEVTSQPGRGSMFAVTVPRAVAATTRAKLRPEIAGEVSAGASILYVEDDPAIAQATRMLLEARGFRVTAAANGGEVSERLKRNGLHVDLILSDYRLPDGETGVDVVQQIRGVLNEDIPAIILTGDTSYERLGQTDEICCQVLRKPVTAGELIPAIEQLVKERRSVRSEP